MKTRSIESKVFSMSSCFGLLIVDHDLFLSLIVDHRWMVIVCTVLGRLIKSFWNKFLMTLVT
jgi:hypothetical protein